MSTVGRPSYLADQRRIRRMLGLVAEGVPGRQAAIACGITGKTYDRWMRESRTAERQLEEGLELTRAGRLAYEFRAAFERASAGWEAATVQAIQRSGSWRAWVWLLRCNPDMKGRYNVPDRLELRELTAEHNELAELPDAELARRIERLEQIAAERPQGARGRPDGSEG